MYQGTTPSFELLIAGHDLTAAAVFVTLESGTKQLTLTGDRLEITYDSGEDKTTIGFGFSQEETFKLPTGTMKVQVRWVDENDEAWVTEEGQLNVNSVLLKKVISRAAEETEEE